MKPETNTMMKNVRRAALTMLLAVMTAVAAWAQDHPDFGTMKWNDDIEAYEINSVETLNDFVGYVNSSRNSEGVTFKMTKDIEYPHTSAWDDINSKENNFTPVNDRVFKGTFDGQGHTLSGIRIHDTSNEIHLGIFREIYSGGVVRGLTLSDTRISGSAGDGFGGIVGYAGPNNYSTISDCHVTNTVMLNVIGESSSIGGILGSAYWAHITNCTSAVTIISKSSIIDTLGGVAGAFGNGDASNNFAIGAKIPAANDTDSPTYGAVVNGMYKEDNYRNNYYYNCTVAGVTNATDVGCFSWHKNDEWYRVPSDTPLDMDGARRAVAIHGAEGVSVALAPGSDRGMVYKNTVYGGVGESVTLTLGYTGDMKGKSFTDGNGNILQGNAIDGYTLAIDALTAGDITINVSQTDIAATEWTVGNGSKAKPYVISYPSELDLLAQRVNADTDFSGKYFKLGADIRYNAGTDNNFTPIGISKKPFKGHFDGAGHTISGIRINRSSDVYVGLFGQIGSGAEVCNVIVDDAVIVAKSDVGVITGHNEGGTLSHNYYHNCTCTQATNDQESCWTRTSDIGCGVDLSVNAGSIDITADDGAVAVYRLSVAATVAITADVAVSHGTDRYCKAGTAVSLAPATAAPEGYYYFYTVDGETNTTGEFTMGAADATVRLSPLTVIPFEGSGNVDDPYLVRYASQFNKASGLWGKNIGRYYKLANNLTFPHETDWDDPNSTENNFISIGNYDRAFYGHFDGDGHTISGIRIYKDGTDEDEDCNIGLFRPGGNIQNLKLADTRITGYNYVGGIVGGSSNVTNCVVKSNVAIHAVQPGSEYHGGVIGGISSDSITNCVSHAKLTLKDGITASRYYGGGVGYCNGTMSHNLAIGVEVPATAETLYATYGAIAGQLGKDATADHNYYSRCTVGDMEDPSSAGVETGGGSSDLPSNYKVVKAHALTLDEGITITDDAISYDGKLYYPDLATVTLSGGLPGGTPGEGQTDGYIVKNSHRSMFIPKHGDAYRFLMPLDDATVSAARKAHPWTGSGTEADPYVITTTEGLDLLAMLTDVGNTFSDTYFKLGADIAYTPTAAWNTTERYANNYTPIGLTAIDGEVRSFCGHFDGAGHIVSGIRIYNDFYRVLARNQGLFGAIGSGAVVSRVNLADASMSGWVVGGIAGRNDGGTVTQCSVADNVAFYPVREPNYSTSYALYFGGIVGLNHGGTVSYCTSSSYFRVPDGFNDRCGYGGIIGWGQKGSTENIISHNLYVGGTIIGQNGNSISYASDGLDHNYYALCTRNGVEDAKDMGIYNSDVTENDGAVYALGLTDNGTGNGERIAANAGKTVPVVLYKHTPWKDGDWCTLCLPFSLATLTGTPFDGLTVKELDTETAYDGHKTGLDGSTLYLNFKDATAIEAGKPYIVSTKADLLINTASEWDEFAQSVSSGKESYQGKTVRLTNDISVTTMAGTENYKFKGTFDGNGHKLTVAYGTADSYLTEGFAAPFRFVEGATVKNLHVAGDIYINEKFAAGIMADLAGDCTVSNCRSSVAIHSIVSGDGTHGGFLGIIRNGTTTMTNCLFDGKMLGANTTHCGGFAGWNEARDGAKLNITNSLFAPTELTISGTDSRTFSRSRQYDKVTIDNSYYTKTLGTAQGAEATATGSALAAQLGDGWTVSGSAAVPKMNSLDDFVYPLFNGATVANTPPASVGFEGGRFAGSYNTCRAAIAINGDANGYSAMSNTDLTALTDYLVGKTTTVPKISNVNGDTTVDIADVAKLIGILTGPRVVTTVKSNVAGISLGGLDGTR